MFVKDVVILASALLLLLVLLDQGELFSLYERLVFIFINVPLLSLNPISTSSKFVGHIFHRVT
jgi:hypothetical protein